MLCSGISAFIVLTNGKLLCRIMMVSCNFLNYTVYIQNLPVFSKNIYIKVKMLSFLSDDFSEELLSLHDAENVRLKQYYEDHKELFEGVHKWEESWRLFLELEVSLNWLKIFVRCFGIN